MEKTQQPKRIVATKCSLSDIFSSDFVKEDGWTPNYLTIRGQKVSRVNVLGTIVTIDENDQNSKIVIDDGNITVNIVFFDKNSIFEKIAIGNLLNVIGKPREFNNEKYIIPEQIKIIEDLKWIDVRKLELEIEDLKTTSGNTSIEQEQKPAEEPKEEEVVEEKEELSVNENNEEEVELHPSEIILEEIRKKDTSEGVAFDEIFENINVSDKEKNLNKLLERGEIFEIRPGKYKVLE